MSVFDGFKRGDSDDDSSVDSDVFGGGGSSSGSGRSPDDLEGTVSFGDGEGPPSPTGGYDPIPGGVDETTTGRAPGSRSDDPFVRPEESSRVSVKQIWVSESGNIAYRIRGTGLEEKTRVRVPVRRDGKHVGRETIVLGAGLPDKTVKTDIAATTGSTIDVGGVYMQDVGGGALDRTDSSTSASTSSSGTTGDNTMTSYYDGFERPDGDGSIDSDSSVFGGDGSLADANPDATLPSGTVTFGDGEGPPSPTGGYDPIPGGVPYGGGGGGGGIGARVLLVVVTIVGAAVAIGGMD